MYVVRTSFYLLNRGMTKQEFIKLKGMDVQSDKKPAEGTFPTSSKTFKHAGDLWEVWVFNVYDCDTYPSLGCVVGHIEHVAFKNGILEEWGTGDLPLTIKQNPNQFQYDINIQNR